MARLQEHYEKVVRQTLVEEFKYSNEMQIPKLEKIVVNMGLGESGRETKKVEGAVADLMAITGQKPVVTLAKKSIANFKLREGTTVGCKVTLRRGRMYEFLDRLVTIALPRVRDFHGISDNSFDGKGNYSLGLKVDEVRGLDVAIVTTGQPYEEGKALLKGFNMPFGE